VKVLVACEYSGVVRDAFIAAGHEAMSCDLLPTDAHGPHYQGDVRDVLDYPWDLMIAHPPCTDLAVSGARHFTNKRLSGRQQASASFVLMLSKASIPLIAIENPISVLSTIWRKPDQIIHPWQFGHPEQKATSLWLKGLPLLTTTNDVSEVMWSLPRSERERVHLMPPSEERWKLRSQTYKGIAEAMATQWGALVPVRETVAQ
jgi:hypothetical protein